jgi:hypothetical protein
MEATMRIFTLTALGWTVIATVFLTGMVPDERWAERYWLSGMLIWAAGILLLLLVRVAVHGLKRALEH